jgi:hypothetical protein
MKSRTTRRFRELLAALPAQIQKQAHEAYELFASDPGHPGLRFNKCMPIRPFTRPALASGTVQSARSTAIRSFGTGLAHTPTTINC